MLEHWRVRLSFETVGTAMVFCWIFDLWLLGTCACLADQQLAGGLQPN